MTFSERSFIRELQKLPVREPVTVGIGDDGAVLGGGKHAQVVVTDMLVDQVHFDLTSASASQIAHKSIAVNLSDLAAMAATPTAAFISLALPGQLCHDDTFLNEFYAAAEKLAAEYRFTIAGGDTCRTDGPLVVNVCLTGVPISDRVTLRSGAKPGDLLVVTGPLGGSLASGRHLRPVPRFDAISWALDHCDVRAVMDISDGLSLDLYRMMEASGTGAVLDAVQIPVHDDVSEQSVDVRLRCALSDGEDFELLMAIDPESVTESLLAEQSFFVVGKVTDCAGQVVMRQNGNETLMQESGFQHL